MAKSHEQHIAEQCLKSVKAAWGHGARSRLGPVIFQALVAREVVSVIMAQMLDSGTVEQNAHCAKYMQEVATMAMKMADPEV